MSFKSRVSATVVLALAFFAVVAPAAAPTTQPVDLLAGASWKWNVYPIAAKPTTRPATGPTAEAFRLAGEAEFQVAYPPRYAALELAHGLNPLYKMHFALNGHEIRLPLEGMLYRVIPGIDAAWLVEGTNVLTADAAIAETKGTTKPTEDVLKRLEADGPNAQHPFREMKLLALCPEDVKVTIGPILGATDEESFTVTCRTNMPARVTLTAMTSFTGLGGKDLTGPLGRVVNKRVKTTSPAGLLHRFKVEGIDPRGCYHLEPQMRDGADSATLLSPLRLKGLPKDGKLRFVAMGDNRSNPESWGKVAAAALQADPDLVIHTGDLVSQGRHDWLWEDQFFTPAKDLLAAVPFYPVIGNHEGDAPLYYELFYTSSDEGRGKNWQQTISGVLLIGIDGEADWSADGENVKWLEGMLAGSKAKFIFLVTHYPAWSSSKHGRTDPNTAQPAEKASRQARQVILPLLAKYRATAMIAGHDHNYQRSEPPEGVTVIVTGGAGAPLYEESQEAGKQNPYSQAFAAVLHYCLFVIEGDACTMQALTPEGETLDTRIWRARTCP